MLYAAIVVVVLALLLPVASAQFAFQPYDSCPASSTAATATNAAVAATRLDIAAMSCVPCATGQVQDTVNPERCVCGTGFARAELATNEYAVTCTDCVAQGTAATRDGAGCMACSSNGTLSTTLRDCQCPAGYIIVERDQGGNLFADGKHCSPCSNTTRVFQDPASPLFDLYTCRACPEVHMVMDATGVCTCTGAYTKVFYGTSETCVFTDQYTTASSAYSAVTAAYMQYNDVQSSDGSSSYRLSPVLSSNLILRYFDASYTNCRFRGDRHACQALTNMCVLQKYSQVSAACLALAGITTSITTYEHDYVGDFGWRTSLPFAYRAETILSSSNTIISQEVQLNGGTTSDNTKTDYMSFRLYKYSFNGTYLGWEALGSQLQLCSGDSRLLNNFLKFGTNYINNCKLDLTPFLLLNETIFYDPYLVDSNFQIYPIPVKVTNLQQADGNTPNRDGSGEEADNSDNVLTRRFYVVDAISGVTAPNGRPKVISYIKKAVLRIQMLAGSSTNIVPPLLVLEYGERETQDILDGGGKQYSQVEFKQEYLKSSSGLWTAAYVLFGIAIALSILLVIRRLWVWQRKNGTEVMEMNLFMFLRFIIYLYSSVGDLFFIVICALTFYTFLFYKGQQTVYYLLPSTSGSEVYTLRAFIIICFIAKLLDVLFKLYQQIKIEIFLIDWEKPKGSVGGGGGGGEGLGSEEEGFGAGGSTSTPGSVSVWRKLFAANKWNDLQSARLINVPLTLFFMIFLMEPSGVGLKYLATAQPSASNLEADAAPLHPFLEFAVTTSFLLVICYLQLLYHKQVTHRYFKDEVAQFVDLLSTSNISALLLDERQHGYYLHGKTVHPHADVSLEEMNAAISAEERTLTRERGLLPGKDSFELYVTHQWRHNYDELYSRLFTKQSVHSARAARAAARNGSGMGEEIELGRTVSNARGRSGVDRDQGDTAHLISSALLRANASLNVWLTSFINREPQFPYPYDIGEHESMRQLLGLPVNLAPSAPCTMYDDPDFKFTRVLMCGIEGDMILFLVLLYAFCNILFQSILVATLVCYIVDRLLVSFRSHFGQINISRKTLLDERFLI